MVAKQHPLKTALPLALKQMQNKEFIQALSTLKRVEKFGKINPDFHHLSALINKELSHRGSAEQHFKQALRLNPNQPQVLNNFGNFLKSLERFDEADKLYIKALKFQPAFYDARRNLAISFVEQKRFDEAIELFEKLREERPREASLLTGLADCHRHQEDIQKAIEYYRNAISVDPSYVNALHNLGLCFHLQGNLGTCIEYYDRAFQLNPGSPELALSYANGIYEYGSVEKAIEVIRKAIDLKPDSNSLHERLNEMLWEQGNNDLFCKSYLSAINLLPNNVALRISQASQLLRAGRSEEALSVLDLSLEKFPDNPELHSIKGQVLADLGHFTEASVLLEKSLNAQPDKDTGHALTKVYLLTNDIERAQTSINKLIALDGNCQLTWALQAQVWRIAGDEKYQWLCDYERFIGVYEMSTPQGYSSLKEFLAALNAVLLKLHNTKAAPLQQTLRHGTQTAARLLHQPIKEVQELKKCLGEIVAKYIAGLPEDAHHPLLSRRTTSFKFSGSWSVKLQPNGFHVNHVHPAGWISSSCYISLPDDMGIGTDANQGSIKFGESPMTLEENDLPERIVKPKVGMVVLFPSYMWHGTYAFDGDESTYRLTAPFDVVPDS